MTDQKILDKLEKLIALSGSSNEHEANLAMEKAIKMAVENNIELSRVASSVRKDEIIKERNVSGTSRLPVTYGYVTDILISFFNVKILTTGNRSHGRGLVYIGRKDDVEFAKYLYEYLNNTFMLLWKEYYKKNPHLSVKVARTSYFRGLWKGLSDKLRAAKAAAETVIEANTKEGYELMLVDHEKALQAAMVNFYPDLKKAPKAQKKQIDVTVFRDGLSKGGDINVHSGLTDHKTCVIS